MHELQRELGLERIVKLGSNEGAFGPLPAAASAFEACAGSLDRYPDPSGGALRERLAARYGVGAEQVVLGDGADELIRFCGLVTLDPGDRAVFPWPSFPSYVAAAGCCGAEAVHVPLRERAPDLDAVLAACGEGEGRTKVVYLANPNNPTGTLLDPGALRDFLDADWSPEVVQGTDQVLYIGFQNAAKTKLTNVKIERALGVGATARTPATLRKLVS